jgi:hypothetical protein
MSLPRSIELGSKGARVTRIQTLCLSAFAIALEVGCGSNGGSKSGGSSLSCGPLEYISGSQCLPLDIADGSAISTAEATADALGDATPDALEDTGDGGDASAPEADAASPFDVTTACLVADNIFVIAGSDSVYTGAPLTLRGGPGWTIGVPSVDPGTGLPSTVSIAHGAWQAYFSTRAEAAPLAVGTYRAAELYPRESSGHPGLSVLGSGGGCSTVTGQFNVFEISSTTADSDAGTLARVHSFMATFEQHCGGGPASNVGCVRVSQ